MGSIRLYGSTSGYLELQAPAVAPDAVLTLPSDSVQPGLVHLHTETFSAVSSVSIDNVFSSTYDNYRILARHVTTDSGMQTMNIRLRSGGVDETSNLYYMARIYWLNSSTSAAAVAGWPDTKFPTFTLSGNKTSHTSADIFSPNKAEFTAFSIVTGAQGGTTNQFSVSQGHHEVNTQADGFTIAASTGSVTGSLSVYGYRNA